MGRLFKPKPLVAIASAGAALALAGPTPASFQRTDLAAVIRAVPIAGKGRAKVKRPTDARFRPLTHSEVIPPRTLVDVSGSAAVELVDSHGDKTVFSGVQPGTNPRRDGVASLFEYIGDANGVVQLALVGGDFSSSRLFTPGAATKPARRLWGSGRGLFTMTGRFAAASDRGTVWEMADYANGSLCTDKHGTVTVTNLVTHTTVELHAGQRYFAANKRH